MTLVLGASVAGEDDGHPPALREAKIDLDRDLSIDVAGLPTCGTGGQLTLQLRPEDVERLCRGAFVGRGVATFEVALREQPSIATASRSFVANGGMRGRLTTLYAIAFIASPVPTSVVATITIGAFRKGRYGSRAVVKVPRVLGGSASLRGFELKLHRTFRHRGKRKSVFSARCSIGRLSTKVDALLRDEARSIGPVPQIRSRGTAIRRCNSVE